MRFYYNKPIDSLKKKRMPKRGENVIGWFLRVDKKLRNIETMSANSSFLYRVSLGSSWVSMGCLFTNNKWRGKQKSERRRRGGGRREEEEKKFNWRPFFGGGRETTYNNGPFGQRPSKFHGQVWPWRFCAALFLLSVHLTRFS